MKTLKAVLLAGIFSLSFSPAAWAIPSFARMYSYNCSTCHAPGYGQLNKFGYNFRAAGYRIPADIGKDMNDGKVDWTNYIAARYSGGVKITKTTQPSGVAISDNYSFTLGGASLFIGGAISKNFSAYSELGLGDGTGIFSGTSPNLSNAKLGWVSGEENEFWTIRVGKFGADGFGASDRGPVGSGTIVSNVKKTGTGAEVGYTLHDTRISVGLFDGIQNPTQTDLVDSKGKPVTSTSIQAPTSDSNNAKDIQLVINQFIGDDGAAINFFFYNGFNGSVGSYGDPKSASATFGGTGDATGQEYFNTALFFTSPIGKNVDLKLGGQIGQTNAGVFAVKGPTNPASGGYFVEADYEMDELTPLVFRYDYTAANLNALQIGVLKFTLGSLLPVVENIYLNPTYALTLTDSTTGYTKAHALTSSLNIFF